MRYATTIKMKNSQNMAILELLRLQHPNAECELNFNSPFELLIAVILSAQCTDKRVNLVTEKLFKVYNTPLQFAVLSEEDLRPFIYSCGFFNNKAKNIINMSKKLVELYDSIVPKTMEELILLDGVGRKTASVVLAVAYNIPSMPVDTHVFRLSRRIGFSSGDNVLAVEKDLCSLFPKKYWNKLHHYLIFHGRYVCTSQKPDCVKCNIKEYCIDYKSRRKVNG